MTPRSCTDGTVRHLSVDLDDAPGGDGGQSGLTLCSALERSVWGDDQWAVDIAYDMHLRDEHLDISALPPCAECLRVAELLTGPGPVPALHRREPRPTTAAGFTGDTIRTVLRTDVATGASPGRRAAVHLLSFTAVPDQPGFGDLVAIMDLPWEMGDVVRMGQVDDWAAVVAFAESADVPARDRQLIAVAAGLAGGPPVRLDAVVTVTGDPASTQRVIEAIAIATGHDDRWTRTERATAVPEKA